MTDASVRVSLAVSALLAVLAPVPAGAQDGRAAIDAAAAALRVSEVRTIQISGWGSDFIFGQAYDGNTPWPRFYLPSWSLTLDYVTPAMRDDRRRAQAENPPLGGGFQPLVSEQRQIWVMSQGFAWDQVPPSPAAPAGVAPAAVERDLRPAVEGRTTQIYLTPHGFLKAALAGNARTRTEEVRGTRKTIVTVTTPQQVTLEGVINAQNLVERVETALHHPMLGDMLFEAEYSAYTDFGGVRFPSRIVHRNGGYPVLDVTVTDVRTNVPFTLEVPEAIRTAKPAAPAPLVPEKLAEGVWALPGNARSVAVEFRDHVVIVDAPESEPRSMAVIDAVKRLVPSKPIRYVVNTHAHFDHASGLRTYAAEGVTIVTHHANIPYYEQVWAFPRTIRPDRLSQSGRQPSFEGVVGTRTLTDGTRRLVLYHYAGNMHNSGMLMVYLPKEKILMQADSYNPPPMAGDLPAGMANLVHFYDAVRRLRLEVDQVVPMHGRLVPLDEIRTMVETYGRSLPSTH
jgi:glyoxylase-like metal-dependent hydrolase (beta-lactamase superfamily II)